MNERTNERMNHALQAPV